MKPFILAAAAALVLTQGEGGAPFVSSASVAEAGQAGPWRHAREPRDRGMDCPALEAEIAEIDDWQAAQAPRGGGQGPSAEQGMRAGETVARRTGNNRAAGFMRDAERIFGGGNTRQRRPEPRGADGMKIADERRAHLMGIYDSKSCWESEDGGYHDETSQGPWLHPRQPRDRGMSCAALETEIGNVDVWLDEAEGRGVTPDIDADRGLDAAQSTARAANEYEASGVIGDVRSVINAGPRRDYSPDQDQVLADTAYMRRDHLMSLFESRACWDQLD